MKFEVKQIFYAFFFPALFVLVLWLVYAMEKGLNADWGHWGILPCSVEGLKGILTGPLIHAGSKHLFSNSIPLLILSGCLFYFYKDLGYVVFPALWLLSGLITWCIGRYSWHIGASGLIYSIAFFLFFSGIFRRYIPLMAISLMIVFLYGSTIWNMFPIAELVDPNVSWEGHLSGAISGLICAFICRKHGPQKPEEEADEEEEEEAEEEMVDTEKADLH